MGPIAIADASIPPTRTGRKWQQYNVHRQSELKASRVE